MNSVPHPRRPSEGASFGDSLFEPGAFGNGTIEITIPNHREIARGTLNDILGAVAGALQQDKHSLIQDLRKS